MQEICVKFSTFKLKKLYWGASFNKTDKGIIQIKVWSEVTIPFLPLQRTFKIKKGDQIFLSKPHIPFLSLPFISVMGPIFSLTSSSWFPFFQFFIIYLIYVFPLLLQCQLNISLVWTAQLPNMLSGQQPEDTDETVLLSTVNINL